MRRLIVALLLCLLPVLPALLPAVPASAAPVPSGSLAKGQSVYVPVSPVRVLDTRSGLGVPLGPLGPGNARDLQAVGVFVPASATAVVLTVTALRPTAATIVRAYPTPGGPDVLPGSLLTVPRGASVANLVTVQVGAGGRIRLHNGAGAVHLTADLAGYYSSSGRGSSLRAGTPTRVLDTRATGGALRAGVPRRLQLVGAAGVPAGTTAVVLSVTSLAATAPSYVRVYPTRPGAPPVVNHLSPAPGLLTTGTVVVPVGADGSVTLLNSTGSVQLLVDVVGHYVGGAGASVFAPSPLRRLLDTRTASAPLGPGGVRDLVVAGAGVVPSQATAVMLHVTALGPTAPWSDVRVSPTTGDARVPTGTSLTFVRGRTVAGAVLAAVGRDGRVRLRNTAGAVHLVVELTGWYGPSGEGWDISWPQCTSHGATTTRHPVGGAFAVVGLTGAAPTGKPFIRNSCFAAQWAWANRLPGEPAVYMNLNAPGPHRATPDSGRWRSLCGTGRPTTTCARAYGAQAARFAVAPQPVVARTGGRPVVWLDVEGPYPNGPFWQTGSPEAIAVNRAVLNGAVDTLRAAGYRVGIYSDRGTSPANDWRTIMGAYRLVAVQNWVFRAPTPDGSTLCTPANGFSGGPVVMVQVQPPQSGTAYDVNHLC